MHTPKAKNACGSTVDRSIMSCQLPSKIRGLQMLSAHQTPLSQDPPVRQTIFANGSTNHGLIHQTRRMEMDPKESVHQESTLLQL